ncbi:MAG TPA: MGMT family protein [Chitinophagales bacterium]|nr:MGMT family protein [Chitinophagales bacterium]HMU98426.1 MGMT family protein [Chitinophagales bacterium]HMV03026.1 MGMT family protein [Chitinophagales bacterium]HMW95031.1 MGMT family protein [Chitinophagales bacterium]HMY42282.1 MGMT family protein [Chitinophagales bacterium]
MNDFYLKVFEVVQQIPYGKVCTYGDIAEFLGTKSSSRLVGYAMNYAHNYDTQIPAHRVVNRNGMLTGKFHFDSPTMMQQLLENEGIIVIDDKIQDFENKRWFPNCLLD